MAGITVLLNYPYIASINRLKYLKEIKYLAVTGKKK